MVVLPKVGWMLWGLNPALMWNKASIRYWMALTPVSGTDPWAVTPAEWDFYPKQALPPLTTAEPVGSAMMEASKALMSWSLTKRGRRSRLLPRRRWPKDHVPFEGLSALGVEF